MTALKSQRYTYLGNACNVTTLPPFGKGRRIQVRICFTLCGHFQGPYSGTGSCYKEHRKRVRNSEATWM